MSQQARERAALGGAGVAPDRAKLLGQSDRIVPFAAYQTIDIPLDPFPHGEGMTTLDAFWTVVSVITAQGTTIISRLVATSLAALDLLTALEVTGFIAPGRTAYVGLAVDEAADLGALGRLHQKCAGAL